MLSVTDISLNSLTDLSKTSGNIHTLSVSHFYHGNIPPGPSAQLLCPCVSGSSFGEAEH